MVSSSPGTSTTHYSLSNVRIAAYLLALVTLLWFAELGQFVPRSLTGIKSINKLHIRSDGVGDEDNNSDEDDDIRLVAYEMALHHRECEGKERLIEILLNAGKELISVEDCEILPTWKEVTKLYGEEPIVYGLETCDRYRSRLKEDSLDPDPRVAGLFDTGTNAFTDSLDENFRHVDNKLNYQAPGGKHTLMDDRKWVQSLKLENSDNDKSPTFLPIVLIRDPFRWMASMCKASYKAVWLRGLEGHCPNLVPSAEERKYNRYRGFDTFRVDVERNYEEYYASLADMWSEWNEEFVDADFPRLIIRFEDTLFHADKVMELVTECVGAPMEKPFQYHLEASKSHGSPADFMTALAKYGREQGRYDGLAEEDKEYVRSGALDPRLMHIFHYPQVPHTKVESLVSKFEACRGKDRLLDVLIRAGMDDINQDECELLPTWDEVSTLYGDEPIIHGLETCERYRNSISAEANGGKEIDPAPRVAGMFNTGTNALEESLDLNFKPVDNLLDYILRGGKHVLLRDRMWAQQYSGSNSTPPFLPVVLVRDPFRWMASMCKKSYKAHWKPGLEGHCPNLVPTKEEKQFQRYQGMDTFEVNVDRDYDERYDSLADYWSEWYREFVNADFPRLIIRFEDTLFHAEKVMQIVSECVGKPMDGPFKYHMDKSKKGSSTDFASALGKYGSEKGRYTGLAADDKQYARIALDPGLMKLFHYPQIPGMDIEQIFDEKIERLTSEYESCRGKSHLLKILLHAGDRDISLEDCQAMPTWNEVTTLYGDGPIVYGLETCERYRDTLVASSFQGKRPLEPDPRVAGLYNTGTNALVDALDLNFRHVEDRLYYNLPGGKHAFLERVPWAQNVTRSNPITFLPVVLVRDPFRWMASMCKSPYTAHWTRIDGRCPNLVVSSPTAREEEQNPVQQQTYTVSIEHPNLHATNDTYQSLADMWSSWYQPYYDADFPRLMVRFEDTLFHAEKVMEIINECVGKTIQVPFQYHLGKAKKGPSSDFPTALGKYGSERGRYDGMAEEDREYARSALDADLMRTFHYPQMPPSPSSSRSAAAATTTGGES